MKYLKKLTGTLDSLVNTIAAIGLAAVIVVITYTLILTIQNGI